MMNKKFITKNTQKTIKALKLNKKHLLTKNNQRIPFQKTHKKVRALSLSLILFSACSFSDTPKTWSIDKKALFLQTIIHERWKNIWWKKLSRVVSEIRKKPTPLSVSFQPLSGHTRCSKDKLNNISPLSFDRLLLRRWPFVALVVWIVVVDQIEKFYHFRLKTERV